MSTLRPLHLTLMGTLLLATALTGCQAGKDYTLPQSRIPALFGNKDAADKALPPETEANLKTMSHWWTSFGDATLNELVAYGLNGNHSLQIVQTRIDEARALRKNALGALLPSVDATANIGRTKANGQFATQRTDQQAAFDASWEINLFGAGRVMESRNADLIAAIADYNGSALSLAAEITRVYIDYRLAQHQVGLARKSVSAQEEILKLTQDLYKADLTSALELSQAETLVKTTAASVPVYERQMEASRQELAVLVGMNADQLPKTELETATMIPMAKTLPFVEAPAAVLARRPDIIAAERRLASATALTGAEIAALYPTLSLSSLFGIQGGSGTGSAGIWSVAAGAAMPLLNFGTIRGRIDAQKAREKAAYHEYEQTLLESVADVETSLSGFASETQHRDALRKAADSARETVRLARLRYENGLTAFTDVLEAQQSLYMNEQQLAASEGSQAQALIAVYKSLGVAPRFIGDDE